MGLRKGFKIFIDPLAQKISAGVRFDPPLFLAILILSFLGLLNLAGIAGADSLFFKKQTIFFIIGFFILFSNLLFDYRIFKNYSFPSAFFFGISIFLLFFTLQAVPVRGVTAWLHLPFGISFETSEVVKLAMILFLARYFSSRGRVDNISTVLTSGLYVFLV